MLGLLQSFNKVVTLGRRAATVPGHYTVDQKAEEASGRLEQHVIGILLLHPQHGNC